MIQVQGIEKSFKNLSVLKGVDFFAEKGKIYGFIGPNGSGKSTLIKTILGLVIPDQGCIEIEGKNINAGSGYRKNIGYMPQIARFPENLKVRELFGMIKGLRNSNVNEEELVAYFSLEDALDKQLKNLSGGTKQKVNAVLAFMFDPSILIFDEPSVGLDPVAHLKFKKMVLEEKKKGKTIIITTHIISELEEIADEIIFLLEGKIYFKGTPATLMKNCGAVRLDEAIAGLIQNNGYE